MELDPENTVVKLCAEGMSLEGCGQSKQAAIVFKEAWHKATNDFERFIAAHYVARHQTSIIDKLQWDDIALQLAIRTGTQGEPYLPSLYLNIGKCYEDLQKYEHAKQNYSLAQSVINFLPDTAYGKMIRSGIMSGLERV